MLKMDQAELSSGSEEGILQSYPLSDQLYNLVKAELYLGWTGVACALVRKI